MDQPRWLGCAWDELGQREVAGSTDNARITALFRDAGETTSLQRRGALVRGLRRRLPGARGRRRHALFDGAVLFELGRAARRGTHRRHRGAEPGRRSERGARRLSARGSRLQHLSAGRQPVRRRHGRGLSELARRRSALAASDATGCARCGGHRRAAHSIVRCARPRDGGRLQRRSLRSGRPDQPRHHAASVCRLEGRRGQLRSQGAAAAYSRCRRARDLCGALLVAGALRRSCSRARLLSLRCRRQPRCHRRNPPAAAGGGHGRRWRDRAADAALPLPPQRRRDA